MTGVCFLVMVLHSRGVMASEAGQVRVFADPDAFVDGGTGLLADRNRIGRLGTCAFSAADGVVPLQRSDMSQMSLRSGHVDVVPDRGNVYFLVGVAQGMTTAAVAQLLAAAGIGIPLHVVFVDKGTVRVIMHGKQHAGTVAHSHHAVVGGLRSNRRDPGATVMHSSGGGALRSARQRVGQGQGARAEAEASTRRRRLLAAELAKRTMSNGADLRRGSRGNVRGAPPRAGGGFLGFLGAGSGAGDDGRLCRVPVARTRAGTAASWCERNET